MGSKLLFRFRSGTHVLNEELGRHSTRNRSIVFFSCECECKSVEHILWECSEHSSIPKEFIRNLDGILQNNFYLKSSFDKTKQGRNHQIGIGQAKFLLTINNR